MNPIYNIGDQARIDILVLIAGVATDPAALTLSITDPSSNVVTYVYLTDAELVRDGVGAFHLDLTIDELGLWTYSWLINGSDTEDGTLITGQNYTLETIDETPSSIPFADVVVTDTTMATVLQLQTDANGEGELFLLPGTYTFSAEKFGFRFLLKTSTLLSPGAGPAKDVSLLGALLVDQWLSVKDLERCVSVEIVDRLFQDTNSSVRDPVLVQAILLEAQALAESKLLRSWGQEAIVQLAFHDHAVRVNAAWIAIELATERRGEFIGSDGKGRYWVQYERAISFFDALSKSKDYSRGAAAKTQLGVSGAGAGSNSGGKRLPTPVRGNNFVFSDEGDGTKHGGF
jgi:hypothetical protein